MTSLVVALSLTLVAQSFEVASIKRSRSEEGFSGSCHGIDTAYPPALVASAPPLGRCVIRGALLDHLLAYAWGLRFEERIKGGPGWARDGGVRFDIAAKAEDPSTATDAQLQKMLRGVLIERFKIVLREETREIPGYALVTVKKSTTLTPAAEDEPPSFKVVSGHPATLTARNYTMPTFAVFFELRMYQPVVDRTRLKGGYDFTLMWDEQNGPSLVTVLRELGLRLEPRRLPALFLVIESAQMPTEN